MGLPTITRGVGFRDDLLTVSQWTLDGGVTLSTDGDIATATNTGIGVGISQTIPGSLSSTTFSQIMIRLSSPNGVANPLLKVTYADTTSDGFSINSTTALTVQQGLGGLTTGKTISSIKFTGQGGPFNIDFIILFKELLTLPSIRQPIALRKRRNMIEIPILQREGGQQQDLGSLSADITLGGHLITTVAGQGLETNTYTADQWWYILNGLTLETGTIQADGNPTWQWFQSDQIQSKVLVTDFLPQEPMGRVQFWDYALQLKKFNVNGETVANDLGPGPGGIVY